jgi:fatty acid desaturase
LLLLAAASSICCAMLWLSSHGNTWQIIAAVCVFSMVNNTVFSLLHESVHRIAHRDSRMNELIGIAAAAFFPTSLSIQRVFHLAHHAHNRVAEHFDYIDPTDRPLLKRAQWYAILTGVYWIFLPVGAVAFAVWPSLFRKSWLSSSGSPLARQTGGASIFSNVENAPKNRVRLEVLFTASVQALLFWSLHLHWSGWLACYAAFAINWSSLQYADHAFSPLDAQTGAWNLRVNPVTRLFFLNYHHHLAHHQNPHVPWLHLGHFIDDGVERPAFWRMYLSMWRGPRVMP